MTEFAPAKSEQHFLGEIPFRQKLSGLIVLSVTFALGLACIGLFALQYQAALDLSDQRLGQMASVMAQDINEEVYLEDLEDARADLMLVSNVRDVHAVRVYRTDGTLFTRFESEIAPGSEGNWNKRITRPVMYEGVRVGTLQMDVHRPTAIEVLRSQLYKIVALFAACLGLSMLVARLLGQMAFRPIDQLVETMRRIEQSGDYAMRLPAQPDRDFAPISASFNAMLTKVQRGNAALRDTADDLRAARDEAQQASVAKSQFLANMSHELRTPLNAILGYAEVLRAELAAAEMHRSVEDLEWIDMAGRQLLSQINSILDLSKIEAGHMTCDCHEFSIEPLVREVGKTLEPLAGQKGNRLSLHIEDGLGEAYSDSAKIRQALLNLGANACKFTENGQVSLTARRDDDTLIFTVADTGIGIPEEEAGRLFEAFIQADASTTRNYGGTGLGLTITAHFAELLDGQIAVQSEPGFGSSFTLSLPARIICETGCKPRSAAGGEVAAGLADARLPSQSPEAVEAQT